MYPSRARSGLTLNELIIVIGGLLLLAALLLPAIAQVRSAASRPQSQGHLRHNGTAVHSYHDAFRKMPPGVGEANGADGPTHFHILPFVEQEALFRAAEGASWRHGTYGKVIRTYVDQADKSAPADHIFQGWLATTN